MSSQTFYQRWGWARDKWVEKTEDEFIRFLRQPHININDREPFTNGTALLTFMDLDHLDVVRILLQNGADVSPELCGAPPDDRPVALQVLAHEAIRGVEVDATHKQTSRHGRI